MVFLVVPKQTRGLELYISWKTLNNTSYKIYEELVKVVTSKFFCVVIYFDRKYVGGYSPHKLRDSLHYSLRYISYALMFYINFYMCANICILFFLIRHFIERQWKSQTLVTFFDHVIVQETLNKKMIKNSACVALLLPSQFQIF